MSSTPFDKLRRHALDKTAPDVDLVNSAEKWFSEQAEDNLEAAEVMVVTQRKLRTILGDKPESGISYGSMQASEIAKLLCESAERLALLYVETAGIKESSHE
jgi:hypothetical protein